MAVAEHVALKCEIDSKSAVMKRHNISVFCSRLNFCAWSLYRCDINFYLDALAVVCAKSATAINPLQD